MQQLGMHGLLHVKVSYLWMSLERWDFDFHPPTYSNRNQVEMMIIRSSEHNYENHCLVIHVDMKAPNQWTILREGLRAVSNRRS